MEREIWRSAMTDEDINAFHQAGHVVMAHLLGLGDLAIGREGCVMTDPPGIEAWDPPTYKIRAFRKVKGADAYRPTTEEERNAAWEVRAIGDVQLITAGGAVAQAKARGERLFADVGGFGFADRPHRHGLPWMADYDRRRQPAMFEMAARAERIQRKAEERLSLPANWRRVESIAAELARNGHLDAQRVAELLRVRAVRVAPIDGEFRRIWRGLFDFGGRD
jgi:hypothetical protein